MAASAQSDPAIEEFLEAVRNYNVDEVIEILKSETPPNAILTTAELNNVCESVRLDFMTDEEKTNVHSIIIALLDHGADPNRALHQFCWFRWNSNFVLCEEIIRQLMVHGGDLNYRTDNVYTTFWNLCLNVSISCDLTKECVKIYLKNNEMLFKQEYPDGILDEDNIPGRTLKELITEPGYLGVSSANGPHSLLSKLIWTIGTEKQSMKEIAHIENKIIYLLENGADISDTFDFITSMDKHLNEHFKGEKLTAPALLIQQRRLNFMKGQIRRPFFRNNILRKLEDASNPEPEPSDSSNTSKRSRVDNTDRRPALPEDVITTIEDILYGNSDDNWSDNQTFESYVEDSAVEDSAAGGSAAGGSEYQIQLRL